LKTLDEIKEEIRKHRKNFDEKLIEKAYHFAQKKHEGQFRKSGEPFFSHPTEVAYILAQRKMDTETIAAGLLHDVLEDTNTTYEELEREFGKEIAFLVEGVTKLHKYHFKSKEEHKAESFRKMLLSMAQDIRVLIIKLADRLHNMRTLEFMRKEKQKEIAYETLNIYAPLAGRLGMYGIKNELEDLSLKYLNPDIYEKIKALRDEKIKKVLPYFEEIIKKVREKLKRNNVPAEITWRFKHIYGIYRKMVLKNVPFDEVYDIIGIRVITDTITNCYITLGLIHSLYPPIPGRLKDYIANPKSNLYQSLHTTVLGPKGQFIEFQIRTKKMHEVAENGIAAHWIYKEGNKSLQEELKRFNWLKELLNIIKEEKNPKEFFNQVTSNIFDDTIYVFTPKGDVIELPYGATALDFAFAIHTELGLKCKGIKVNGKIVPLDYTLSSGDKVVVLKDKNYKAHASWLRIVKTSKARQAIRSFLRKQQAEKAIEFAKKLLEKHLSYHKLHFSDFPEENLENIAKKLGYAKFESLLLDLGLGRISLEKILKEFLPRSEKEDKKEDKKELSQDKPLEIEEIDNIVVKFSKCCYVLPGDEIVGVIKTGNAIFLHFPDCPVVKQIEEKDPNRIIKVRLKPSNKRYKAVLRVLGADRPGLLADITQNISKKGVNIIMSITKTKFGSAVLDFIVEVKNKEELENLISSIKSIEGVKNVKRIRRYLAKV